VTATPHPLPHPSLCPRCPVRSELLPRMKGVLACPLCGGEVVDDRGMTSGLTPADYRRYAAQGRQLREARERCGACEHALVMVSVRPWCAVCGITLTGTENASSATAVATARRLVAQLPDGELGEALRRGVAAGGARS